MIDRYLLSSSEHELKDLFTILERVKVFIRVFEDPTSVVTHGSNENDNVGQI